MDTKHKIIKLNGVILSESDYKEYDKLLTILTKEKGKISVYAFSVRRQNSKSIGGTRLFTFAEYNVKEINDRYELDSISIIDNFNDISKDYDKLVIASYFVELVNYVSQENVESDDLYNLLYYSFKAITLGKMNLQTLKRTFELKLLKYEGLYKDSSELLSKNKTLIYTWDFIINSDIKKLFSFNLNDEIFSLFDAEMNLEMKEKIGKKFNSLKH